MNNYIAAQAPMLEETGDVVAVEGRYVVIETQRRSACGSCAAGDSCGTSVLAGLFSQRRSRVRLPNHLGLSTGDRAVIGINESVLLYAAVLAYMLPLVLMVSAAVLTSVAGFGDDTSFGASLAGLFVGMRVSNRIMGGKDFQQREIVLLRTAGSVDVRLMHTHI